MFFKTAITGNASSTFSYRIYVYEGLNVVSSGHTVNVAGYCMQIIQVLTQNI